MAVDCLYIRVGSDLLVVFDFHAYKTPMQGCVWLDSDGTQGRGCQSSPKCPRGRDRMACSLILVAMNPYAQGGLNGLDHKVVTSLRKVSIKALNLKKSSHIR